MGTLLSPAPRAKTVSIFFIAALVAGGAPAQSGITELRAKANEVFGQLPPQMPGAENDTPALAKLGKKLFLDKRLSENKTISCNSCHRVDGKGGAYHGATSPGASGKHGDRNSPTVLNAGFHFAQFWDGRVAGLEAQAREPMVNPVEMGMPAEGELLDRLRNSPLYPKRFSLAFPDSTDAFTSENVAKALAAFERTLITHDRFDDFLKGKDSALTRSERKGLELFLEVNCQKCHNGPALGGNSFQKMGLVHPYSNTNDIGRARVTHDEADQFQFKVPSLRNVALTAPYFHDGQAATLEEAISEMAYLELDRKFTPQEVVSIESFLHALSDKKRVRQRGR